MLGRLSENDVSNLINVENADEVRDAVLGILAARYPGADFSRLQVVFEHVKAMYAGRYPGLLASDTLYHDLRHALDAALATTRLIDGHDRTRPEAERLGARRALLGVIITLLHDSGMLRRTSESNVENGALFTKVHIARSADFMLEYLPTLGLGSDAPIAAEVVHFTGYEIDIDHLSLTDPRDRVLGCVIGTADLLSQMADRTYLEKCRDFLYPEFVLAGIARFTRPDGTEVVNYSSAEDLLAKTPDYYDKVLRKRMDGALGGVDRFAGAHFADGDLYRTEIDTKMSFLREAIENARFNQVRRACYSLSVGAPPLAHAAAG